MSSLLRPAVALPSLFVAFVALGAACGSSSSGGTGGSSSSTSTTTSSTGGPSSSSTGSSTSTSSSTGSSTSGASCMGKGYGGGEKSQMGGTVSGKVVDQNGMAVAAQPIFICGLDICSPPGKTAADGTIAISTNLMMKKAALKFGDALHYAELAIPLASTMESYGTVATAKLPSPGAAITAGTDAVSGNVTVSVPAGATVQFDELVYTSPDQQTLRIAEIPVGMAKPVIDASGFAFEELFGLAPAGTTICPAAKVTVPNSASWPAGTTVEFYVMSVDVAQQYAPYAGWAKASDGAVSADGKTIVTADGQGMDYLDVFAIRKKP